MKAVLALVAVTGVAHAGTPVDRPEAIEVDRDQPPPGQVELGFDGGAPIGAWALGVDVAYLDRPMRLHTVDLKIFPVEHRETVALGGAIALGDSVIVDARMPLSHQVGQRYQGLGDDRPLDPWVPGDLRVGARLHVHGGAFLRAELTLPTGDDHDFAGDAKWSGAWLLVYRRELPHDIVIAATGGIRLRGAEVKVADDLVGDEIAGGVGATVGIPPMCSLWCRPDQLRATAEIVGAIGDNVANQKGPSPLEVRFGVIGKPRPGWLVGVHVGTHLDDQIGAPRFRAMLQIAYQAPMPVRASEPVVEPDVDDDD